MFVAFKQLRVEFLKLDEFGVLVLKALLQFHELIDVDLLSFLQLFVSLPQGIDFSGLGLLHPRSGLRRDVVLLEGCFFGFYGVVGVVLVGHVGVGRGLLSNHIRY